MMVLQLKQSKLLLPLVLSILLSVGLVATSPLYHRQDAHASGGTLYDSLISRQFQLLGSGPKGLNRRCPNPNDPLACFTPAQLSTAYAVQPLYQQGVTGKGQTIAVIVGSQDPSLVQDLHQWDQTFGVPDPPLNIFYPQGPGAADPGVSVEITLDVEAAHALAPDATINLVLANTDTATTLDGIVARLIDAAKYAVDNNLGDVMSLTFSEDERCVDPTLFSEMNATFARAAQKGITVLASSGDTGATGFTCDLSSLFSTPGVSVPASNPDVTAVGGTNLITTSAGVYNSESAWTQVTADNGATGGGFSSLYAEPSYQQGISSIDSVGKRAIPDFALLADPRGGLQLICSFCNGGTPVQFSLGGTSISAPLWAGILALGDQKAGHRLGNIHPALYKIGESSSASHSLHDIVGGNNTYTFTDPNGVPITVNGYSATRGWDPVTGWGTPKAVAFLPLLIGAS